MVRAMRMVAGWLSASGIGFARSMMFAAAALLVPAACAAVPIVSWLVGSPWSWVNLWSWAGLVIIICAVSLALARTVGTWFRRLTARWSGLSISGGYPRPPVPVEMSTGFWWNGHSYERSRRDAELDLRWRRFGDGAFLRDVRWLALAAATVGPICAVPPAALVGAVIILAHPSAVNGVIGALLVVVAAVSAPYAWRVVDPIASRCLGLSDRTQLADRVRKLTAQRADATTTQAAEIRRIERDLHDGTQARLVALGLSLATAEKLMDTDPDGAKTLLRDARAGASASLTELRELVRGITPPVLSERGLVDGIRALALDSPLDVSVNSILYERVEMPVESALYFATSELLANATKHAAATRVDIRIGEDDADIVIEVEDNGHGGATLEPEGGLSGLQRRLAVFDGTLTVDSPTGGPTRATIMVPCESS